jgi:hypothetical protein
MLKLNLCFVHPMAETDYVGYSVRTLRWRIGMLAEPRVFVGLPDLCYPSMTEVSPWIKAAFTRTDIIHIGSGWANLETVPEQCSS